MHTIVHVQSYQVTCICSKATLFDKNERFCRCWKSGFKTGYAGNHKHLCRKIMNMELVFLDICLIFPAHYGFIFVIYYF